MPFGVYSKQNLIDNGLYWNVPATELIFLTHGEHKRLHNMNISDETRDKLSKSMSDAMRGANNPFFGKHHTEESRAKMSAAMSGANHPFFGKHHTDETREKMSKSISVANKGKHWFNNGEKSTMAFECPQGFVPGRLKKRRSA